MNQSSLSKLDRAVIGNAIRLILLLLHLLTVDVATDRTKIKRSVDSAIDSTKDWMSL